MTPLLNKGIVTHEFTILDAELKAALAREAMESFGLCDEAGKPLPGVTWSVLRTGRNATAGYANRVTRDLAKSGQALLPKAGE